MTKRLIIEANNVQTLVDLDETELQAYNDRQAELEASPVVMNRFHGPGLMNRYFRQILNRKK